LNSRKTSFGSSVNRPPQSLAFFVFDIPLLFSAFRVKISFLRKATKYAKNREGFARSSMNKDIKKVVLAYSGGLDTSAMLLWLKETYGCEVVCYTADVGQGEELSGLQEKAAA